MNQTERRKFLIKQLLSEYKDAAKVTIPEDSFQQKLLLRSLVNSPRTKVRGL